MKRAIEMLNVAAKHIRNNCPDATTHYDEADCDGYCVADDCESAAEKLSCDLIESEGHTPHCAARLVWGDGECECGRKQSQYKGA